MNRYKKILLSSFIGAALFSQVAFAQEYKNDLRTLFENNGAVIYALNIRNFNASDLDGDGIISFEKSERSGNFINAIQRLDELKDLGINTIHLLPITPVGRAKALGTAGSVYSLSDFASVNPQLDDSENPLSVYEEAKLFVEECHKRNIRVMLDLPSCGSYDLFLTHPELFIKDDKGESVIPLDWTDVRAFKSWNDEKKKVLNEALYKEHVKFVDMCLDLGIDGIRADVARFRPDEFWEKLISYARSKNPQFAFLAESSDSWKGKAGVLPPDNPEGLLKSGFDSYYGSFFNIYNWKSAKDLNRHVVYNLRMSNSLSKNVKGGKSAIGSFSTHDQISPVLKYGVDFNKFIAVLNSTLPDLNPYFVSGFETGDTYEYPFASREIKVSYTDSNKTFVHPGRIDIFNFSRKPHGKYPEISELIKQTLSFREENGEIITKGYYLPLKLNAEIADKVVCFTRFIDNKAVFVVGNFDFKGNKSYQIKIPKYLKDLNLVISTDERNQDTKCFVTVKPGKIKVFTANIVNPEKLLKRSYRQNFNDVRIINNDEIKQGSTAFIEIKSWKRLKAPYLIFKDKKISLCADGGNIYKGMFGIDAFDSPGEYKINFGDKSGILDEKVTLKVASSNFPVENIVVPDDKSSIILSKKELGFINEVLSHASNIELRNKAPFIVPTDGKLSSYYGLNRYRNGKPTGRFHEGIDIAANDGDEIKSVADGKVILAKRFEYFGNTVIVDHGQGLCSVYMHLSRIDVKEKDRVRQGEKIGEVGSTGYSTGSHLHFGIYVNGVAVNPLNWIKFLEN